MEISRENKISILTYPRSGRHWLYWYINTNTDLKANFTHYDAREEEDLNDTVYKKMLSDPIITVVRNPIDSISSINTMEKNGMFVFRMQQYIDHYNFVLKNASMFFYFEDVINNTSKVVNRICKEFSGNLDIKTESYEDYSRWYSETQNPFKLITSKNNLEYSKNMDYTKDLDLSEHYRLYGLAKLKCIRNL
jgi:hypothetical protein